ncbi:MAG: GTPase ObgE [Actinomycetota bacterium]
MTFADEATLFVRGGKGGDGAMSFRREPYTPRGGPNGGDGGKGGDVTLEVSTSARDLSWFADHPHQRAKNGEPGSGNNRRGADAPDLVLRVPDGTVVRDERGLVADLVGEGARVVVGRGGRGGRGNAALAGPRDRAPRRAEAGELGEERRVGLELRLVADVGLVGLPNAGKSTLLSTITAARPKVADYPFTTLTPNLGVAGDDERFVVADVPGLVEGAHEGRGLGHRFLRHVTRCRALAVLVDLSGEDPVQDLLTVRSELTSYDAEMGERPQVLVGTKSDLVEPAVRDRLIGALGEHGEAMAVSAVTGEGVEAVAARLHELARAATEAAEPRKPYVVLRPGRERFVVRREGERFRVIGRDVERWVLDTDFDDARAVAALQKRLAREGVERQLAANGARRGDEVVIGEHAFEFYPDQTEGR